MSKNIEIKSVFKIKNVGDNVSISGWVKTFRSNRFIALNDGSCLEDIQCVINFEEIDNEILSKINTGTSLNIEGEIVKSQGKGQSIEILVKKINILGLSDPDKYPIQPKKHSFEFLRENAHLRVRTKTISSVMRIRSEVSYAIHKFFNENNFYYVHTPIITGSDAEGAGEMFKVTTLDLNKIPKDSNGEIDFTADFFSKETNLTVSGQLEAESMALGLGKVYTFGPTFRAENSNTSRHLAEFWMIEPEMAFYELDDNINLAEEFIKYIIKYVYNKCKNEIVFLSNRLIKEEQNIPKNERSELSLEERINFVINNKFVRITYTEAFEILKNSKPNKKGKFKYPLDNWGIDFQSEHERFLVEKYFKSPVVVYDYPSKIKAFYMRMNDDNKTVRAMDILFPGIGEIVGGSQREERIDVLKDRIKSLNIDEKELWWYLDLRKFGTVKHSGFGLGLERLILFITGMSNIRDVIPFPRTPKNADF
jgi:asparaginyl-tRNA synthetase